MKGKKFQRAVVGIYIDPDFYPPTINAILNIADKFDEVIVVSRNNSLKDFSFPENVTLRKVGKYISVRESEKLSTLKKIFAFLHFLFVLCRSSVSGKSDAIILYDPIPLFAFYLFRFMLKRKTKVWYHNHDMPSINRMRKFSIGWFSAKYEQHAMRYIDHFSLPSVDRLQFYPWVSSKTLYSTIPNYPSVKVYKQYAENASPKKVIRLIYQGFIGPGHALEELIGLLNEDMLHHEINLLLKGSVKESYKESLTALAGKHHVSDKVYWFGIGPYEEVPALTSTCDIGIGIHMNTDDVSKTLGTASNKIYEYAASGLPVLLYDITQFTKYLSKYKWTFFSDGTPESLRRAIEQIIQDLPTLSRDARTDFEKELNFDIAFHEAFFRFESLYEGI